MVEHVEGPMKREFFVAHSFTKQYKDDLRRAVEDALCGHLDGLEPYYADTEIREGHIFVNKIIPKIKSTEFGIYEISEQSPNVFLELGAAIALGITYYILCRKDTKIPADLQGLGRIEYESFSDLTKQLKEKVLTNKTRKHLGQIEKEHIHVNSEVISKVMNTIGQKSVELNLQREVLRVVNEVYPDYMNSEILMQKIGILVEERKLEIIVAELEELGDVKVTARSFDDPIGMVRITAQGRKRI